MPNALRPFNPAYSTIKAIYLANELGASDSVPSGVSSKAEKLNIAQQNTECVFERIEIVENANDIFPNGILVVRDTKDIASRIKIYEINKVLIEFFDSTVWKLDITSVSYLNNAASDTEENFVGIYFTNKYYKQFQQSSLNQILKIKKPSVYNISDFVNLVHTKAFDRSTELLRNNSRTDNYVLYRPINTIQKRDETVSDNPVEYLNYLSSYAVNSQAGDAYYMFWTEMDGSVNFKYFYRDLTQDPSYEKIQEDYRRIGIYDGDSVLQKLSNQKIYRKCYFYNTNPSFQYISKNYYYIRKTPKLLDLVPLGLTGATATTYITKSMAYHFQDEGEKYNIELINQDNTGIALPGADQLIYKNHWGYYDGLESLNYSTPLTHVGQKFGLDQSYGSLNLMGLSGFMPYVDNVEMWKNCFDLTPVHPSYCGPECPIGQTLGSKTYLQYVLNARYNAFLKANGPTGDTYLTTIRNIEMQNFIMYSLCCMGRENTFFAVLTRFEEDQKTNQPNTYGKKYLYSWKELKFDSPYDAYGPGGSGYTGAGLSGSTCYYFHELEKWKLEGLASSTGQDHTWAINLNERGISGDYLPAGWISPPPGNFKLRPIGAKTSSVGTGGNIFHIVKMYRTPVHELLIKSGNELYPTYEGNFIYYFTAENVLDGPC